MSSDNPENLDSLIPPAEMVDNAIYDKNGILINRSRRRRAEKRQHWGSKSPTTKSQILNRRKAERQNRRAGRG